MKKTFILALLFSASAYGSVKSDYLSSHNYYRKSRGFEDIQWSTKLQMAAADHASKCTEESSGTGYGENIYLKGGAYPSPFQVVHGWKPESEYRNFYQSTWLGCAATQCGGAMNVVVCMYYPGVWG